jgi:hypothetical protein
MPLVLQKVIDWLWLANLEKQKRLAPYATRWVRWILGQESHVTRTEITAFEE